MQQIQNKHKKILRAYNQNANIPSNNKKVKLLKLSTPK